MTAADIVARLREHGHRVMLDGSEIVIRPRPHAATIAQIRGCRSDVVEVLRRGPLASEHRYVLWSGALDPASSVCIACGKATGAPRVTARSTGPSLSMTQTKSR